MIRTICVLVLLASLNASAALSERYANRLATAIYWAEGGSKASRPYGIMSSRRLSEPEARQWCLRTIRNSHARWEAGGKRGDFIPWLAKTYCPLGDPRDKRGLNNFWISNVTKLMKGTK